MSESSKWKSKLLSSSVPLEYEVAKILASSGFSVNFDYSYSRDDGGVKKDFSVDIHAEAFLPFNAEDHHSTIELLVECKYRHRNVKWLFLRDPNIDEMSPFMPGQIIRAVDEFSPVFIPKSFSENFDDESLYCMKGIEIDPSSGGAHDTEIRHGLAQLQYALPRLITDTIRFNILNGLHDNLPFLFCPILLTTCDLLIANDELSIKSIEAASSLEDISSPVPYLVLHLDSNPDFERHRLVTCAPLADLASNHQAHILNDIRKKSSVPDFGLPSFLCSSLSQNNSPKFYEFFSKIIVCSMGNFENLISKINRIALSAGDNISKNRQ